jgi:hypothetical protein
VPYVLAHMCCNPANPCSSIRPNTLPLPPRQVAELGVPYVLTHMRGDPTTMQRPEHTSYPGGVWQVRAGRSLLGPHTRTPTAPPCTPPQLERTPRVPTAVDLHHALPWRTHGPAWGRARMDAGRGR